jgi:hypothetical protein
MHACLEVYDEIIGGWRNPHNEELHNLYSLPNILTVLRSRRYDRYVAREKMNGCRVVIGKPEGSRALGRRRVGGRIILRWIVEK